MKIHIYYGGRGLLEDPTLMILEKTIVVLKELRVEVCRYNLFEDKNSIATLPATIKECDGIILAASCEWFGIGGLMQQFLDMCWLYGDKNKISQTYMMPLVVSTAYGEKDCELYLSKAWEILGGISLEGISTYVYNIEEFEEKKEHDIIIEKRTENFYRGISKKITNLPTSSQAIRNNLIKKRSIELTPAESEQLSKFVSDDGFVKKQKKDIEELAAMFKQMLGDEPPKEEKKYEDDIIKEFSTNYFGEKDFKAKYVIILSDVNKRLILSASDTISCRYGEDTDGDILLKADTKLLRQIIDGSMTFQKGFMSGEISAKGDFKTLRMLDQIFRFKNKK